jgi:predicted ferric reductase
MSNRPNAYAQRTKRRLTAKDFAESLIPLTTAVAVALFFANGGMQFFTSLDSLPYALGVVSGLIGTNLFLVMLVLAARVPFIDNLFGQDRALMLHKKLGKPVLYLMLVHMAGLVVDYAMRSGLNVVAQALSMINTNLDMLMAFLAMGVMIAIVVTSLVAVKKALPYRIWHLIHLSSYAAMLLGVFHQFSWSGMFRDGTVGRYYWLGLYVLAVGGLVVFRIITPLVRSLRHQLIVDKVEVEGPGVVSIYMYGRDLDRVGFTAGKFAHWRFLAPKLWQEAHPFSISAVPTSNTVRITVRALGDSTTILQNVRPGTRVLFEGPYGAFTNHERTTNRVVLIGSGIGLAPIRALVEDLPVNPGEMVVVGRAHTEDELYLMDEITDLAMKKKGTVYELTGRRGVRTPWLPHAESEQGATITDIVSNPKDWDFYLCGPELWMDALEDDLRRSGVPEIRVHSEKFAW